MNSVKQKILVAMLMIVMLCGISQAAEYFTTDGGVSVIPVFANTGAADTAMGTPVQGALIYSTSDGGIMYYDGSAWVSIESVTDGTAANNTLRWNGSNWVESTALTNDGTDITATGDVAVNGGDITTANTTATLFNTTATTVNIAGAGTTVEIGATDGTTSVNNSLTMDGNTTIGNASGDMVTANAAAWTFASDTAVTLSGGVNGLNFDSNSLSIDAANDRIGIGTAAPGVTLDISAANDALDLPEGTTAQRPGTPAVGMIRYNSTTNAFEGYSGSTPAWVSLATALWENGANGVFEDDEAVIVGADAAFTYVTSAGTGDLRVADDFEAVDDGFIGGDLVVGASTSATETLSNTGFTLGGDDLFVAGLLGVEGNIYTDGDVAVDGGDITSSGSLTVTPNAGTNLNVNLSTTGDFAVNTDDLVVDTSVGSVGIGTASPGTIGGQQTRLDVNGYAGIGGLRISGTDTGNTIYSEQTSLGISTGGGTNQHIILNPNGNVGIGTTAPTAMLHVTGAVRFPWVSLNTTVAGANVEVDINGVLRRATSSRKIKKDIDYNGVNPNLALQFKPVSFTGKADNSKRLGFIAEDMRDIDERFVNSDIELPGLEMSAIVSALTSLVQVQQQEIDILKTEVSEVKTLQKKLSELEARIEQFEN